MSNPFASGPQGPQGPQGQPQPYGQQPQPPQQYGGQVPPQQPYGQQPPPNYYAAPPQPPQRKPWMKYIRIGIPVIIAIVAAVVYFTKEDSAAQSAKVGDCMEHVKKNGDDDLKTAECGTPQGEYTIIAKFEGTTDFDKCEAVPGMTEDSAAFSWNGSGKNVVLCLNPVAGVEDTDS